MTFHLKNISVTFRLDLYFSQWCIREFGPVWDMRLCLWSRVPDVSKDRTALIFKVKGLYRFFSELRLLLKHLALLCAYC